MRLDHQKTAPIAALLPIRRRKMKNCLLLMTELISTGMDANGSNHRRMLRRRDTEFPHNLYIK